MTLVADRSVFQNSQFIHINNKLPMSLTQGRNFRGMVRGEKLSPKNVDNMYLS